MSLRSTITRVDDERQLDALAARLATSHAPLATHQLLRDGTDRWLPYRAHEQHAPLHRSEGIPMSSPSPEITKLGRLPVAKVTHGQPPRRILSTAPTARDRSHGRGSCSAPAAPPPTNWSEPISGPRRSSGSGRLIKIPTPPLLELFGRSAASK